jgi:hypothetical protein
MFGAFSFGKIIKTILPGTILCLGVLMAIEAVALKCGRGSALWFLTEKERLTAFTAALVPLSLLLGFFLNTFLWMTVNRRVRAMARQRVDEEGYAELRRAILDRRNEGLRRLSVSRTDLPRASLEYYFLPRITQERLGFVWESYFSWYEFQMNSAYALLFAGVPTGYYLALVVAGGPGGWLVPLGVLVLACVGALALCRAALENHCAYERSLLVLIAGALAAGEEKPQPAP